MGHARTIDEASRDRHRRRNDPYFVSWLSKRHGISAASLAEDAVDSWYMLYENWKVERSRLPSFKWQDTPVLTDGTAKAYRSSILARPVWLDMSMKNRMRVGSWDLALQYMALHRNRRVPDGRYIGVRIEMSHEIKVYILTEDDALRPDGAWPGLFEFFTERAVFVTSMQSLSQWARDDQITYNG